MLGDGNPFNFSYLSDPYSCYMGSTPTMGSFNFNIFTKTKKRLSYNALVYGMMGSGKSTLLKKLIETQTLFGDYNPGGRLSVTFPKTIGQIEFNFPFKPGSQDGQYFSGPNGSGNTRVNGALYPFGHGLSYTTFNYSNLAIKQETPYSQSPVHVTVDVTNTGKRAGDEVVQLYVRDKVSSVIAYESVLRGFERISLQPGETRTVSFTLLPEDLEILDRNMEWTVEPGEFEVRIGASSTDIKLKDTFVVK